MHKNIKSCILIIFSLCTFSLAADDYGTAPESATTRKILITFYLNGYMNSGTTQTASGITNSTDTRWGITMQAINGLPLGLVSRVDCRLQSFDQPVELNAILGLGTVFELYNKTLLLSCSAGLHDRISLYLNGTITNIIDGNLGAAAVLNLNYKLFNLLAVGIDAVYYYDFFSVSMTSGQDVKRWGATISLGIGFCLQ